MHDLKGYDLGFCDGLAMGSHITCKRAGVSGKRKREIMDGLVGTARRLHACDNGQLRAERMQELVDHFCNKDNKNVENEVLDPEAEEFNSPSCMKNEKIEFMQEEFLKMFSIFSRHFFNELSAGLSDNINAIRDLHQNICTELVSNIETTVQDFLVCDLPEEMIERMRKIATTDAYDTIERIDDSIRSIIWDIEE